MLYRNIGGGNRLNFTCIGAAVNLAARPERIAARLGRTVVASEGFAGMCRGGWSDLGTAGRFACDHRIDPADAAAAAPAASLPLVRRRV
jgi:class 3 adenylate cyclase